MIPPFRHRIKGILIYALMCIHGRLLLILELNLCIVLAKNYCLKIYIWICWKHIHILVIISLKTQQGMEALSLNYYLNMHAILHHKPKIYYKQLITSLKVSLILISLAINHKRKREMYKILENKKLRETPTNLAVFLLHFSCINWT